MREKTFHVYVDSHDRSLLLQSLVELKNLLIQQGRYTDCVDELIFKVSNAPIKKFKIQKNAFYSVTVNSAHSATLARTFSHGVTGL